MNLRRDLFVFVRAFLSNQLAGFAPRLYLRFTGETGRGEEEEDTTELAKYFVQCFHDYREQLGLDEDEFRRYLRGKTILEYGPGDILGVALLMYASGAESVCCTDRFPLEKTSAKSTRVYSAILEMLGAEDRERARNAFTIPGRPESGFNHRFIDYSVTRDGLTRKTNTYDLILSRAVLEHVEHVELTIADMADALKKDGVAVHKVDLKSHGLDRGQPLDFLTWSPAAYRLMHSHKGFPNRWRVNKYREIVAGSGLDLIRLAPTEVLDTGLVDSIRPSLAGIFRNVSPEDLSWLGFWMVLRRK